MAPQAHRQKYGNAHIAGSARVQLGDRRVTKNINIKAASILLQDVLTSSDVETLRQALRIAPAPCDATIDLAYAHLKGADRAPSVCATGVTKQDLHKRIGSGSFVGNAVANTDTSNQIPKFTPSAAREQSPLHRDQRLQRTSRVNAVVAPVSVGTWSKRSLLSEEFDERGRPILNFPSWLSRFLPIPRLISILTLPTSQHDGPVAMTSTASTSSQGSLIDPELYVQSSSEIGILLAGILSYIFGQNLSVEAVGEFLAMCQQCQILGFLTCLLCVGFYKYLATGHLAMSLCSPDKVILEDAYGRSRPFSIDVCADVEILTKFLQIHYQNTSGATAGALVTAGQFHLMLGSRRGRVISCNDLRSNILKPGYRIVNSVYVSKDGAQCLTCSCAMTVTALGEFHCPRCKVYHRDCDTLMPLVEQTAEPLNGARSGYRVPQFQTRGPSVLKPAPVILTSSREFEEPEQEVAEYDVHGLVNLDLKIQPRRPRSRSFDLAEVLHTFEACDKLHLPVVEGQIVTILSKNETSTYPNNQWWLCDNHFGLQNYVPQAYLRKITPDAAACGMTMSCSEIKARSTDSESIRLGIPPRPALNAHNITGKLLYAAETGCENAVQGLLNAGANVHGRSASGETALVAACSFGRDKVVQLLLNVGADVNAQGGHYRNALQAAARSRSDHIVQILLDAGADVNADGGQYGNALQAAARSGSEHLVRTLLNAGADVDAQGGQYGNALQAAARSKHEHIVQILLDAGAPVNAQGGQYGTALQAAAISGSPSIIQTLLSAGANVNLQGGYYGNALQAACVYSNFKIVQMLLDAGANVNAQGGVFGTALGAASENVEYDVRALLLQRGAIATG